MVLLWTRGEMMGITISFGIQKGGVGKTTTTSITAWLLSKNKKVLAVDFDSQGNMTQFLTQRNVYDFTGKTVLEACKELDAQPYIQRISDNLHLLPSEDLLATFSRWLYRDYKGEPANVLKDTLAAVKDDYDYIVIDCPPNLGDLTANALVASDYTVPILQSEPFCLDALDRYLEVVEHAKTVTPLKVAGILTTMMDARGNTDSLILDRARELYAAEVFKVVIRRRSRIKDFSLYGITDQTKPDRDALEPYVDFIKELKARVTK